MSNRVIDLLAPAKPKPPKLSAQKKKDSSVQTGKSSFSRTLKKASGKPAGQEPSDLERPIQARSRKSAAAKPAESAGRSDESDAAGESVAEEAEPRAAENQTDPTGDAASVAAAANESSAFSSTQTPNDDVAATQLQSQAPEAGKAAPADGSARANVAAFVPEVSDAGADADLSDDSPIDDQPAGISAPALTDPSAQGAVDAKQAEAPAANIAALTRAAARKDAASVDSLVPEEPSSEATQEAAMSVVADDAGDSSDAEQQPFDAQAFTLDAEVPIAAPKSAGEKIDGAEAFGALLTRAAETRASAPAPASPAAGAGEQVFADANHPQIISHVRQELLPNGGTMRLRLDPPELGALQVTVHMRDGLMTASFQTSNDQATRLLSHSLHQLKQSLEAHGVSIERMQVQQGPRGGDLDGSANGRDGSDAQRQQSPAEQHSARQEQQRREMMQRLWRRLSGSDDFVDLVA